MKLGLDIALLCPFRISFCSKYMATSELGENNVINREDWFNFIRSFFTIQANDRWLNHVVSNWNFVLNKPGCGCRFWYHDGQNYTFCQEFLDMEDSRVDTEENDTTN